MTVTPNPITPIPEIDQTNSPAPEQNRKPTARRKPSARRGTMLKMVATPEIQARYETACKRLEAGGEALNREVWEMVKSELESLYEFKAPKSE